MNLLAEELHKTRYVYLINDNDMVVALAPDFPSSAESSFLFNRFDIPGRGPNRLEQFLKEYNIAYRTIAASFLDEAISQDGRLTASSDGIYSVETGEKIVEGYSTSRFFRAHSGRYFAVRGWTYDGSGVIYSSFLKPCLIETSFFLSDEPGCFFEVSQPLLKLRVPEEYLMPELTP